MPVTEVNYPDPGFFTATSLIQLGYGIWAHLTTVSLGLAFGFTAVAMPQLMATTSEIEVSSSDESWIASSIMLAAPIGCLICGYCMDNFGRRCALIFSHVPCTIGWLCTALSGTASHIIIGRVICGVGLGFVVSAPRAYTTEITLPNMRGVIGALPNLAISLGITIQATMGSSMGWRTLCYICAAYEIVVIILNFWLPETPYYVLTVSTIDAAEVMLRKFRSKSYNIQAEIEELVDFKEQNNIIKLTLKQQVLQMFTKAACKPLWIFLIYGLTVQMAGITVIIMYAVEMLSISKSSVEPLLGNVFLGIARMISGFIASALIFKFGRRPLALASGLGVAIVCVMYGNLVHFVTRYTVFPLILHVAYVVFASMGHYTLPVLIMYEMYPLQIRGLLGGVSLASLCLFIFASNSSYPYLRDRFGFRNTIFSFGVWSFIACVFIYFYLPETKDLTLQEIEEYFNDVRPTLSSQRRIISMQNLNRSNTTSIISLKRPPPPRQRNL